MGIFSIPYRWSPGTFFSNIGSMIYSIRRGIRNIIRWTPIIWHDEDSDWDNLAGIMEWKLRKMSVYFKRYGHHVGTNKDSRDMLVCAEAIRRIRAGDIAGDKLHKPFFGRDFYFGNYKHRVKGMERMAFKLMGRRLRCWWD